VGAIALIVVVTTVLLFLISGKGSGVEIMTPKEGSVISGKNIPIEAQVKNPDKLGKIEVYLDKKKKGTLTDAPFKMEIVSDTGGSHELLISIYDKSGAIIEQFVRNIEVKGQVSGAAYAEEITKRIIEAGNVHQQISGYANRANSECRYKAGYVPAGLMAELQDLYKRTSDLKSVVEQLLPDREMVEIHSKFLEMLELLRVRAEALVRGCQAAQARGDYTTEFQKGGTALNRFKVEWPNFLNLSRQKGLAV